MESKKDDARLKMGAEQRETEDRDAPGEEPGKRPRFKVSGRFVTLILTPIIVICVTLLLNP